LQHLVHNGLSRNHALHDGRTTVQICQRGVAPSLSMMLSRNHRLSPVTRSVAVATSTDRVARLWEERPEVFSGQVWRANGGAPYLAGPLTKAML
jgi:hypothetical protein